MFEIVLAAKVRCVSSAHIRGWKFSNQLGKSFIDPVLLHRKLLVDNYKVNINKTSLFSTILVRSKPAMWNTVNSMQFQLR